MKVNKADFRQIYDPIRVGIARISLDFRIECVNKAYCRMLGYSEAELMGKHLRDITHPETVEANLALQSQLAAGKINHYCMEKQFIHKNGSVVHGMLDASLVRDADGRPSCFLGSVVDITDRNRVEKALQENAKKVRAILDASPDVIHVLDRNGIILASNKSFAKKRGLTVDDVVGKSVFNYCPVDVIPNRKAVIDKVFRTGRPLQIEDRGDFGITEAQIHPILNSDGTVAAAAVYARDITQRKQTEEMIKNLNKSLDKKVKERTRELKRLNEYILYAEEKERKAVAADLHDSVAQTLAISISKIKNIQESGEPMDLETIAEIQGHLEQAIKEIRSMVYQLSPPVLDDFEIDIALGVLIEEMNEKYGVDIKYINHIDSPVHLKKSNKIALYRAVNELIINIIKHSGSKDAVIEISEKENFILLRVEDTGVGFDLNKEADKNFCRFGIYNTSERIKNLGGNFNISSKPGKGTSILFSIPLPLENDSENEKKIT